MGLFEKLFGKKVAEQITPESDKQYNDFLRECIADINERNKLLDQQFGVGHFERWDIDQDVGDLVFSNDGTPQVVAKVVIAGTYSLSSESWMWGWANSSLAASLTDATSRVREYGEENNLPDLTEPKTDATEDEAWAFASLACRILDSKGIYRGPAGQSYVFMIITDLKKV